MSAVSAGGGDGVSRAFDGGMDKRLAAIWMTAAVLAGCTSGKPFAPGALSVSPADSAPGRTETVVIEGASGFTPGAPVVASFGPDVAASAVVTTPDRIVATVTIGVTAALGSRAVMVTQAGRAIGMAGAFTLRPPFVVEGHGVRAGEWTEIHLRGLRTEWTAASEIVADPSVRIVGMRVDAPDDLTALVQVDLFATPSPVTLAVDGEQAPAALRIWAAPVADLGDTADVIGSFDGPFADFRVWRASLSTGEVADVVARSGNDGASPALELYDPSGSGFDPVDRLDPKGGVIESSIGRPVWIVVRGTPATSAVALRYDFSFRRITASPLSTTAPTAWYLSEPAQVDAWHFAAVAPWSLVHMTVDASGWMEPIAPVALANRSSSWQSAGGSAGLGGVVDLPMLATSAGEWMSVVIRSGSDNAGCYRVTTTSSPLPGALFSHEGLGKTFDAAPGVDSVAVSGAPVASIVHIAVDLAHPASGNLHVTITSPSGRVADVAVPTGNPGHVDLITAFPDLAAPAQDFSELVDGGSSDGLWTLTVSDPLNGTSGTLRGWAISFE